jgi:hypothetical protein
VTLTPSPIYFKHAFERLRADKLVTFVTLQIRVCANFIFGIDMTDPLVFKDNRAKNCWTVTGAVDARDAVRAVAVALGTDQKFYRAQRTAKGYRVVSSAAAPVKPHRARELKREWLIRATDADLALDALSPAISPARLEYVRKARALLTVAKTARTNTEAAKALQDAGVQVLYALRLREPRS